MFSSHMSQVKFRTYNLETYKKFVSRNANLDKIDYDLRSILVGDLCYGHVLILFVCSIHVSCVFKPLNVSVIEPNFAYFSVFSRAVVNRFAL